MNNRFTEQAQEAIQQAHEILQQKQHTQLDNEHILLSLLKQKESTVARILEQMNVDRTRLADEVDKALDNIPRSYGSNFGGGLQIYITMRVKRLFEFAAEEADRLNDTLIGTEHLFLAVATDSTGPSARLLQQFGIDAEKVNDALLKLRGVDAATQPNSGATRRVSSYNVPRGDANKLFELPERIHSMEQEIADLREQMQSLGQKVDELLRLAKGEHNDQP